MRNHNINENREWHKIVMAAGLALTLIILAITKQIEPAVAVMIALAKKIVS